VDTAHYRHSVRLLAGARDPLLMYFVYVLECSDRSLYTGITTDLKRRFAEHKRGQGGHYTASHPPKKVLYHEKLPSRSAALKREAQIKKLTRVEKLVLIKKRTSRSPVRF
jgi:putative endonuclease